jgi:hypothetical protein
MRLLQGPGTVLSTTALTTFSAMPKTCTGPRTSFQFTNPKRSRLLLSARQEIDDDPGVEAAVAGAWQDGDYGLGARVALAGGVALYLFGIAFVDRVNEGVANGTALSARLGTAAFLLALAVAGSPLPPLAFMTLVVVALLALTAFEAVSASP